MILEREHSQRGAVILPDYFGTDAFGAIVGTSSAPGVEILKNMIEGLRYQRAFGSGSVALLNRSTPQYSRKESWSAFKTLSRRIEELLRLPETDALGRVRPDSSAVARVKAVLFAGFDSGATLSSQADVCTDADGAIHITWEIASRNLELVCPFEETDRTYIYFFDEANDRLAFDFSRSRLRTLFSWLNGWTSDFPR